MKRGALFFLLLGCFLAASAQKNYDVSSIPKELLANSNSVVREEVQTIEIKADDDAIEHIKRVVTILNPKGDKDARVTIGFYKSDAIKSLKGVIYNGFGIQINKFSNGDFVDYGEAEGSTLFEDVEIMSYAPPAMEYPYTIAYEYELKSKQTLYFDQWRPIENTGQSVEKSTFSVTCKPGFDIRYKAYNVQAAMIARVNSDHSKSYEWVAENLKAIKYEPLSPNYENFVPVVKIAPDKFSFYGLNGQFKTWDELGKWMYDKLIAPRQELPQETVFNIRQLTKDISDPKQKAKKVYEYMQGKTHYISVQAGVGGWQPFLASDVDKQKYGDCKALVNYTQALLKAVGVDSWYCVVHSGWHKVDMTPDFPNLEGDHIILCIPFKNDTTWADCTSQTIPFGYLGDFTDDRVVLACTPDGGKLLRTPKYTVDDDLENRTADFVMNADGGISGTIRSVYKGVEYEDRDNLVNETFAEQAKKLQKIYPINNMEISHYELKQDKSFNPATTENLQLTARDYASFTGGKYFFMLNPVDRIEDALPAVMNRQNDVYINRGYTEAEEITYTLPAGYKLEKEPLHVVIDKPFARFSSTMELNGNKLIYKRELKWIDGTYSKDTYGDVVDFFQNVADADSYTVALSKN